MKALRMLITAIGFMAMMLGGCSVMDEYGNLQPIAIAVGIMGAIVLLIIGGTENVER